MNPITDAPFATVQADGEPWPEVRDAAFPHGISSGWKSGVGGYFGGPRALNIWRTWQWGWFPHNRKLPIWVAGLDGTGEAYAALDELAKLGVPRGRRIAVDMETRVDKSYLTNFGAVMDTAGMLTMVYGSASTVFHNPELHGYWVASYAGIGPFMYLHEAVRMTQYEPGPGEDKSTAHQWVLDEMWLT